MVENMSSSENHLPFSDEVYNGMWLGQEFATLNRILIDKSKSESEREDAFLGRNRLIIDAHAKGDRWYSGPTRERPIETPEEDESFDWRRFGGGSHVDREGDTKPSTPVHQPPVDLEPVLTSDPAFDEKPGDRRLIKTLKGHARNMDVFAQENELIDQEHRTLDMFGIGLLGGVLSVAGAHAVTELMLNHTSLVDAATWMRLVYGTTTTIAGSYILNQVVFMDNIVRKWIAPRQAGKYVDEDHSMEDFILLGEEIIDKKKRDAERKIVSTIAIGDVAGKLMAGLGSLALHIFGPPTVSLSTAPEGYNPAILPEGYQPYDFDQPNPDTGVDVPDESGGLAADASDLPNLDAKNGYADPPYSFPGEGYADPPYLSPGEDISPSSLSPDLLPLAGETYTIQPDDQMLQVLLDHVTNRPYSDTAALDFLKLNRDTILEAWGERYGNEIPMLDNTGEWSRVSVDFMRGLIDNVIARGQTPTESWGSGANAFNNFMNSLRLIPPGTEVILPQATK